MKDMLHDELNPCKFKYSFKKMNNFFGITARQFDTIFTKKMIIKDKVIMENRTISKGAYYRVKDQAITNVTKSIMLVSLLVSCDIISYDDMISVVTTTSRLLEEDVPVDEIFKRLKGFLKNKL